MSRLPFSYPAMDTYSLLQTSLDQTIDRSSLEEASVAVPSVARADCAKLQRELFGILVSGLTRDEALAFQAELRRHGFPTDLVADRELPVLHHSSQVQRIERRDEVLLLTDSMGRAQARPITDLVFLAAGFLNRSKFKTEWHQHLDFGSRRDDGMPRLVTEREFKEETELEFRLDFFFWTTPNRLNVSLGKETAIFHQGKQLRLRDTLGLRALTDIMARLLPPERRNAYLRDPDSRPLYPGISCYEEEIRWQFHRLKTPT